LAQQLRVPQTLEGWLQEAHPKLKPVDAPTEGIFLCGAALYPKGLADAAAQGQAAAMRAAGLLFQTELRAGELVALIDAHHCRRCLTCVGLCPFGAVSLADGKPVVRPEVCRGCGVCAAECPARAIAMSRSTDLELTAQIEAALGREASTGGD
jgi:heterodisulfide reductase subunit A